MAKSASWLRPLRIAGNSKEVCRVLLGNQNGIIGKQIRALTVVAMMVRVDHMSDRFVGHLRDHFQP